MDEKIPFNFINISKISIWNLSTATLVDTLKKDRGYERLKDKKNAFTENKNNLLLDILKEYYEWLYFFRKDAVTLPQY